MIRINEIKLSLDADRTDLKKAILSILRISESSLIDYKIVRKSVDARKKDNVFFTYSVNAEVMGDEAEIIKKAKSKRIHRTRAYISI